MLIPTTNTDDLYFRDFVVVEERPTRSFRLEEEAMEITEKIDDKEALVQSIREELQTEKGKFMIYSDDYGISTEDLLGANKQMAAVCLKDRIEECVMKDERVTGIDFLDMQLTPRGEISVMIEILSIYGNFKTEGVFHV